MTEGIFPDDICLDMLGLVILWYGILENLKLSYYNDKFVILILN